jgi:elongation factor Ts
MSNIAPQAIKDLRERTGVGMSKCKAALVEANGDVDKAIELLRKAGMASGVKKEGRDTNEGRIGFAQTAKTIALTEVNAETDFVTQNVKFGEFLDQITKQAAETEPTSIDDFLKSPNKADPSMTIDQYRNVLIQSFGENIRIKRLEIISKTSNASYGIYSHMGGKIVCLVEIEGSSSVDGIAKDIAMHVASENPEYLTPDQIPQEIITKEKEIAKSQIKNKPDNIIEKILIGKLNAYYDQICLLNQKYIKDSSLSVKEFLDQNSKKLGSELKITRFWRWTINK